MAVADAEFLLEEQKKAVEADLEQAIEKGRRYGISDEEIRNLVELIMEG
ncbi:DNA-binding transcriptional regulator YhcF (GntR family) [Clostridiales Family XIII bacterium PM5-7]